MHVFIESAQRTPTRQAVSATHKCCAHHPCFHCFHSALLYVVLHTVHRNFQKCNFWWMHSIFGVFRAFYPGHFSYDFRAQGVTLKSKASATKCVFQIYSQLLDICTRLVLKSAGELSLPSVHCRACVPMIYAQDCNFRKQGLTSRK